MPALTGFSLLNLPPETMNTALRAQERALSHFKHFKQQSIILGVTRLELWGRADPAGGIHYLPDGSLLALIGSPVGTASLAEVAIALHNKLEFELPWDGRYILLKVSADGKNWTIWNDWLGSIPVFHADVENGRLASTLEPVTVAGAGYTPADFFLPGLVSMLINGHALADWTLYKGMRTIPADSVSTWDEKGFGAKRLWTIEPSQSRWEAGWDDLVDEMYALSRQAIVEALSAHPKWNIPLSSGLDSRLIAGVAASIGANVSTYAWGGRNTTDVKYSRQIAQTLGLPWKHISHPADFLTKYTRHWADMFGSGMIFHGMYQMCFLDALKEQSDVPVISGFIGDTLAGDAVLDMFESRATRNYQLETEWYSNWTADRLQHAAHFVVQEAFEANADNLAEQIQAYPGALFQKHNYLELWNRQRHYTSFSSILLDYWCGVATPFLNRAYARFSFSLPRIAFDDRRLLADVFRRYYGPLAVIPGTYAKNPFILTGKYLIMNRIAQALPQSLHIGPLKGFGNVQLRMDIEGIQATGKPALWPLFENLDTIANWLDVDQLERDYQTVMKSKEDVRPLRRLQAAQTLAYRLMNSGI